MTTGRWQEWYAQAIPPIISSGDGAVTAFGHFGIEWDLTEADADDLTELAAWIRLYKRDRALSAP